jgi:hypothetical protein
VTATANRLNISFGEDRKNSNDSQDLACAHFKEYKQKVIGCLFAQHKEQTQEVSFFTYYFFIAYVRPLLSGFFIDSQTYIRVNNYRILIQRQRESTVHGTLPPIKSSQTRP